MPQHMCPCKHVLCIKKHAAHWSTAPDISRSRSRQNHVYDSSKSALLKKTFPVTKLNWHLQLWTGNQYSLVASAHKGATCDKLQGAIAHGYRIPLFRQQRPGKVIVQNCWIMDCKQLERKPCIDQTACTSYFKLHKTASVMVTHIYAKKVKWSTADKKI